MSEKSWMLIATVTGWLALALIVVGTIDLLTVNRLWVPIPLSIGVVLLLIVIASTIRP